MTACELCGEETAGRYLCERHIVQLAKRLDELPKVYDEVGHCLVPRGHGWGEIVATRGAAGPRSPIDEDVLDTVNWVRAAEVMRLWRVDVQRERWPQHSPPPPPADLAGDCRWLAMELDWIVDHYPGTGDLFREAAELESQARTIVGDPAPRPQRLGTCVAVDSDGVVCGAVVSRLPGQTRVQCRWCSYSYESEQDWLLLLHFQPKDGDSTWEAA
ncbi:hypothetical protein JL475_30230 [Streptomyces sp. M2CJ-2]|uniref:hypothetical protein n=1 Tax=Streptomyces sp. M2CJ-2 TaxID=2803948 RepID=UPI0019259196|nr:hypothetical protein [Streptomyces sp. M2CJ-2]MBL3670183.1 hypothetical protein [Streptomyces sp. M2CJ-2]